MSEVTREEIDRLLRWCDFLDKATSPKAFLGIVRRLAAAYQAQKCTISTLPDREFSSEELDKIFEHYRPPQSWYAQEKEELAAQQLVWSDKPPDKPGWWWLDDGFEAFIVQIRQHRSGSLYWQFADCVTNVAYAPHIKRWAGPIPEPISGESVVDAASAKE